jgi:hypothetical protein
MEQALPGVAVLLAYGAEAQRRRGAEAQRRAIAWRSIGTNRRNPPAVAVAVARLAGLALAGLSLSVYWRA